LGTGRDGNIPAFFNPYNGATMNNLPRIILDTKGLLMHVYHRGTDPNSIILDDNSLINRAEFGFENFLEEYLLPILKTYSPLNIIAVWDGGKNYRKMVYPKYKANREKRKEDEDPKIEEQLNTLCDLAKVFLANLGCINVYVDGVEADDTIALICEAFSDTMKEVKTVDADLLQLADDFTYVSLKNEPITEDYIFDKKSGATSPLNLIRVCKSLVGDQSDGYGGVPGVGPAAWKYLLKEYGEDGLHELEACVKDKDYTLIKEVVEDSGCKVLKKILDNTKTWETMYDLASLHPELCYGFAGRKKVQPIYYKRLPDRETIRRVMERTGTMDYFAKVEPFLPTETLVTGDFLDQAYEQIDELLPSTPVVPFESGKFDP